MPSSKCRIGNGDQVPKVRMFSFMGLPMKYRSEDHCSRLSEERERWKIQSKWHFHLDTGASLILRTLQRKLFLHSLNHSVLTSLIMHKYISNQGLNFASTWSFFLSELLQEVSLIWLRCVIRVGKKKKKLLLTKIRRFHFSFHSSIADKIEVFIFPLLLCKSISLVYDFLNIHLMCINSLQFFLKSVFS